MTEHFRLAFATLQLMIGDMAALAEHAVVMAINAVENHDIDEAQKVITGDSAIDDAEIRIEEECLKILALYQPVAGDLRKVITVLKINNELERVADLAVNISERVANMVRFDEKRVERFDFSEMAAKACAMLKKALDAMSYHDVVAAAEVIRLDDEVDLLHKNNYDEVREMILKHPDEASYYMDCLTISRCLERTADIATNISEDIIYLEHGRIVRHCHEDISNGQ
ncbi:MAG: phosphate signaling complex protein PhoU [Lentisphaeria bacterium]|jgi:phosphate transport system protein